MAELVIAIMLLVCVIFSLSPKTVQLKPDEVQQYMMQTPTGF